MNNEETSHGLFEGHTLTTAATESEPGDRLQCMDEMVAAGINECLPHLCPYVLHTSLHSRPVTPLALETLPPLPGHSKGP